MAANLKVKISTEVLIAKIKAKILEHEKTIENYGKQYQALVKKYDQEMDKATKLYRQKVKEYLDSNQDKIINSLQLPSYNCNRVLVHFDITETIELPRRPDSIQEKTNNLKRNLTVLRQALDVLSMTTQTEVSSSAYIDIMPLITG